MKKIVMAILLVLLLSPLSWGTNQTISVYNNTTTVVASGTNYSPAIDLSGRHGYFSIQIVVSGAGTLTVAYQLSNSEIAPQAWSTPVSASSIAAGLTTGTYLYKFEPQTIGKWMRLSFTETGTANSVVVTSNLAVQ